MNIDFRQIGINVALPPLAGANPPTACPLCGLRQIPPESDEGIPPLEEPTYACDSSYLLPEGASAPEGWKPHGLCWRVSTRYLLAWLRERFAVEPGLAAAAKVIARTVSEPPLYRIENGPVLAVTLPPTRGEQAYESCPICASPTAKLTLHFHTYACGASCWSTSLRPGPGDKLIPVTWACSGSCPRASAEILLRVLRARDEPEWSTVCDEALAALAG